MKRFIKNTEKNIKMFKHLKSENFFRNSIRYLWYWSFFLFLILTYVACSRIEDDLETDLPLSTDAESLLADIKRVEYMRADSLVYFAEKLMKLEEPAAVLYAKYYLHKANFLTQYNESSYEAYNSIYDDLRNNGLKHLMAEIDIHSTYFDYDFLHYKRSSKHVMRAMEYCFDPEMTMEKYALIFGVSPNATANTPLDKKQEILNIKAEMDSYPWSFYHSRIYRSLAVIHFILEDYEEAHRVTLESIAKNIEHNIIFDLSDQYDLLAKIDLALSDNVEKYIMDQTKGVEAKRQYGQEYLAPNYRMMGHSYFNVKQFANAYEYYKLATESRNDDEASLSIDLAYMGWAYFNMDPENHIDEALAIYERAISHTEPGTTMYRIAIERKLWSLQGAKRFKEAKRVRMEELEVSRIDNAKLYEADMSDFQINTMLGLKAKGYRLDNLRSQNLLNEERLLFKKILVVALILLTIMVSVLFYMIVIIRKNIKESKALNDKLQSSLGDIEQKHKDLRANNKKINKLLQLNERTLFSKILKISTYHDALNIFAGQISQLVDSRGSINTRNLRPIKNGLQSLINEDEIWEDFKIQFEKTRPNFFIRLNDISPNLSVNDLKHCTYIMAGLRTKDVAGLINVSPRSVETARYRLKKKFDLGEGENLQDFLAKVA